MTSITAIATYKGENKASPSSKQFSISSKGAVNCGPSPTAILRLSETRIGERLGKGAFCVVDEVHLVVEPQDDVEDSQQPHARKYAMKHLRSDIDSTKKMRGATDLVIECDVLQALSHPNIISIAAISESVEDELSRNATSRSLYRFLDSSMFQRHEASSFFLVEEILVEAFNSRINAWKQMPRSKANKNLQRDTSSRSLMGRRGRGRVLPFCMGEEACNLSYTLFGGFHGKLKDADASTIAKAAKCNNWKDRMSVASEIASAIAYLHSHRIVYRDLKPDNIGFSALGTVKLFDFGMAKPLCDEDRISSTSLLYNLTGCTGSPRYMAPEVAMKKPYNEKVDVYSFGVLLWQMCSLEVPFSGLSYVEHFQSVVVNGVRPKMDAEVSRSWPDTVADLVKQCWDSESSRRPDVKDVYNQLDQIQMKCGCDAELNLNSIS